MRKQWLAVAGMLAAAGVASAAGPEGGPEGPQGRRPGMMMERLRSEVGLSDSQIEQLKKIHMDERKAAIRRHADLQIARIELRDLMAATSPDKAAVDAKVKQISDLQAANLRARVDGRMAARKVMTPEQLEKAKQLRMQHRERGPRPDRPRGPRHGLNDADDMPGFDDADEADPADGF